MWVCRDGVGRGRCGAQGGGREEGNKTRPQEGTAREVQADALTTKGQADLLGHVLGVVRRRLTEEQVREAALGALRGG